MKRCFSDRRFRWPVNASSAGQWERLGAQTQEPFIRYEKVFFGPEISLARRLHHRGVGALAAIKIGYFGTNLAEDWRPAAPSGNRLYATMQREIARALGELRETGRPFRLGGFFWMQGETDASQPAHAAAYAENLRQFIAALRHDLAVPALPFIVGRIGPQPPRGYSHQASVRQAQVTVIESASAAGWTDTDDLPRGTDGIHLLAAGVITLGERWADAWQKQRGSR